MTDMDYSNNYLKADSNRLYNGIPLKRLIFEATFLQNSLRLFLLI